MVSPSSLKKQKKEIFAKTLTQPLLAKAYGSDKAPAPSVAEHKLNTLPRTDPSRNHFPKASRGSAAFSADKNGVDGDHGSSSSSKLFNRNVAPPPLPPPPPPPPRSEEPKSPVL